MANAYRTAASGACTAAAKSCYLQQAQYYDCLNSQITQSTANCVQPASCTSSGCAAGSSNAAPSQAGSLSGTSSNVTFNRDGSVTTQYVPATTPQVVDFNVSGSAAVVTNNLINALDQIRSSNVTFNRDGSVTTQYVPTTPPPVVDFNAPGSAKALANNLMTAMDQAQSSATTSQSMAQSLTSALDRQLNSGSESNQLTAQDLAQQLLDAAATQLAPTNVMIDPMVKALDRFFPPPRNH